MNYRSIVFIVLFMNAYAFAEPPVFPLKVSENHRYLVDQNKQPFFLLADTPWFLQHLPIEDVRRIMDDRCAKGFNTLFLEFLDDQRIPSRDFYGNVAFHPDTDITQPVESYWHYADQVLEEAEKRGLFVIMSELWYGYGKGLWLHHVNPDNAKVYGEFIGKRYARFDNLMWMQAGDHNPDDNLAECTRVLAKIMKAFAPQQMHTAHNQHEYASAVFYHDDSWLDVDMGYTYGASYLHILPEYHRSNPIRPVILGETGYEKEPNAIELLPDANAGDLWNPYRIRRNAWWAILSGACGYCAGTRLWRFESNWREVLDAESTRQAPLIRRLMETLPWQCLVPDERHEWITDGYGTFKQGDYVTGSRTNMGDAAVAYIPSSRTVAVNLSTLSKKCKAFWYDPTNGESHPIEGSPFSNSGTYKFSTPGKNNAGDTDWALVVKSQ